LPNNLPKASTATKTLSASPRIKEKLQRLIPHDLKSLYTIGKVKRDTSACSICEQQGYQPKEKNDQNEKTAALCAGPSRHAEQLAGLSFWSLFGQAKSDKSISEKK
jgi:hypothetical protein